MYQNKDGKFENSVSAGIVTSDYSGSFSLIGIKAIVADVLDKSKDLTHWVWYQKPAPDAGITPEAIDGLIQRYQHLDKQGCVGLAILNRNVLIKSFSLPNDGSITFPVMISRSEDALARFCAQALESFSTQSSQTLSADRVAKFMADADKIAQKYSMSCMILEFSQQESASLVGENHLDNASLTCAQLHIMQTFIIVERLLTYRYEGDKLSRNGWLNSPLSNYGITPRAMLSSSSGLNALLKMVRDDNSQAA